jgi:CheY-like chemotaxis protein
MGIIAKDSHRNLTRRGNATRLLLVEDDDLLREVLAEQLDDEGYEVLAAANGNAAIALLAAEVVDIIITDLFMPGMDGVAVIRVAQELWPRLPAVLLTGYVGDGVTITTPHAVTGSYLVLLKPIRLRQLVDQIEHLLGRRRTTPTAKNSLMN